MRIIFISKKPLALAIASVIAAPLALAGCGADDSGGSEGDAAVQVSATTTILADMAANVAGDRAEVDGILEPNSDPHDYEPKPSDAEGIADAELVIVSGGDLDLWAEDLIESSDTQAEKLVVLDRVETIEGGHSHGHGHGGKEHSEGEHSGEKHSEGEHSGDKHSEEKHSGEEHSETGHSEGEHSGEEHSDEHSGEQHSAEEHSETGRSEGEHSDEKHGGGEAAGVDPHWWHDPQNAVRATEAIRDELIEVDPEGAAEYRSNAAEYIERLKKLDSEVAECMQSVPEEDRKLVTNHDAFGYYAERYDIEVVGSALQSLSTQAQPSAGETAELVEEIESEGVNAVFPQAGLNADLERAIADDTDATVGGKLWAGTVGPEDSEASTYIDAVAANTDTMVTGFTGGEQSCEIDV